MLCKLGMSLLKVWSTALDFLGVLQIGTGANNLCLSGHVVFKLTSKFHLYICLCDYTS